MGGMDFYFISATNPWALISMRIFRGLGVYTLRGAHPAPAVVSEREATQSGLWLPAPGWPCRDIVKGLFPVPPLLLMIARIMVCFSL